MVAVAAAVAGGSVHAHRCRVEEEEMETFLLFQLEIRDLQISHYFH
jgi:hypothetical protein